MNPAPPGGGGWSGRLVARTERLDFDVDLVAVAGDDGFLFDRGTSGLAAIGSVAQLALGTGAPADRAARVAEALGAIEATGDTEGADGCGPVAFGALDFDEHESASGDAPPRELVVPEVVVRRSPDGARWLTVIRAGDAPDRFDAMRALVAERATRVAAAPTAPATFEIAPTTPPDHWCTAVASVRERIRHGEARKVVLAREVVVRADCEISRHAVLGRLRATFPGCMLFSVDGFVGASPELLVSRSGDIVRSHPLAGTVARSGDPATDARRSAALLASAKDREEHRITIDMVHDTLLPFCSYLDEEAEPSIVAVANVAHLGTMVEGRLSSPPASVIELVSALHPTPAVCGDPRDVAAKLIAESEQMPRGRYAGPVGWVDATGNGEWAVGIRSAEIEGTVARLFAGVGVVADSDPTAELAETRAKLQAMLAAIVRP